MLSITNLRCEDMCNPLGIDIVHPRLTWSIESTLRNTNQSAFQLIISKSLDEIEHGKGSFFDSGKQERDTVACLVPRPIRESATRYYWSVRVWDNHGESSEWSEPQWFETGLLYRQDWVAKWIEPKQRPVFKETSKMGELLATLPQELGLTPEDLAAMSNPMSLMARVKPKPVDESVMNPCPMLRKEFKVKKKVKRARAYATAHGLYRLEINGKRVGDLEFMPEATAYDQYLQYQTYDVTDLLNEGENAVGAILADGWWAGRIGLTGESCTYGDRLALLLQINIEYEDGKQEKIGSDHTFTSFEGPIRFADLYMGEKYDARYDRTGWSNAGYPQSVWQEVIECDYDFGALVGQNAEPIRVKKVIKPIGITISPKGETIVDFGQCLSGNAKFALRGKRGQQVAFSYTQQTDKDGNYDINILMPFNNQHKDYYIFSGDGEEVYEPTFTYRGFRYVRVEGYEGELDIDKIEARLIASDVESIGDFRCSDPDVTRLHRNIQWTLISNLMSIPTDNPDRERAGWTGDHQMIATTMYYNLRMQAFIRRWMVEHRLDQTADGNIHAFIPFWYNPSATEINTPSGWGDNCIISPWIYYQEYGDLRILEENFEMMTGWMEYVLQRAALNPPETGEKTPERLENYKYIWNGDYQHGDWMTPSENFDDDGKWRYLGPSIQEFVPSFYMAYTSDLMVEIATILGKSDAAAYYRELGQKIRKAVRDEFFDTGYIMNSQFQGVPVLSLKMNLVPEEKRADVANRLVELIAKDGGKANVGFTSNEHILGVLCDAGKVDVAYDLLFQEEMPSWLYMAKKGTTIWEAWQVVMPDGTVNIASLIQYALANVGKWLYTAIGGIEAAEPGYKKIKIEPILDPKKRITSGEASLMCPYGKIVSSWALEGNQMVLRVIIPANTTAMVVLPGAKNPSSIMESDKALDVRQTQLSEMEDRIALTIGSGEYVFRYELN